MLKVMEQDNWNPPVVSARAHPHTLVLACIHHVYPNIRQSREGDSILIVFSHLGSESILLTSVLRLSQFWLLTALLMLVSVSFSFMITSLLKYIHTFWHKLFWDYLHFLYLSFRSDQFSEGFDSIQWRIVFRKQNIDAIYTYCYTCLAVPKSFPWIQLEHRYSYKCMSIKNICICLCIIWVCSTQACKTGFLLASPVVHFLKTCLPVVLIYLFAT